MRKLRWLFIGLVAIVAIACLVAARRPTDQFTSIKPYVYGESISYTNMSVSPSSPKPHPYVQHVYWLQGVDEQHVMQILDARMKEIPDLKVTVRPTKQYFSFHATDSRTNAVSRELRALPGAAGMDASTPANVKKRINYTVLEEIPLTAWQTLIYKLGHRGNSPF